MRLSRSVMRPPRLTPTLMTPARAAGVADADGDLVDEVLGQILHARPGEERQRGVAADEAGAGDDVHAGLRATATCSSRRRDRCRCRSRRRMCRRRTRGTCAASARSPRSAAPASSTTWCPARSRACRTRCARGWPRSPVPRRGSGPAPCSLSTQHSPFPKSLDGLGRRLSAPTAGRGGCPPGFAGRPRRSSPCSFRSGTNVVRM